MKTPTRDLLVDAAGPPPPVPPPEGIERRARRQHRNAVLFRGGSVAATIAVVTGALLLPSADPSRVRTMAPAAEPEHDVERSAGAPRATRPRASGSGGPLTTTVVPGTPSNGKDEAEDLAAPTVPTQLPGRSDPSPTVFTPPPQGPRILFQEGTGLVSMRTDGSDRRAVVENFGAVPRSVSSDGRKLLLAASHPTRLLILDLENGDQTVVVESPNITDADLSQIGRAHV
jgi:predicted component of type VI protein secretion system